MRITAGTLLILCSTASITAQRPPQLTNLGPSCYMNAMLQCMHNIDIYRKLLLPYQEQINNAPKDTFDMVKQVTTILNEMRTKEQFKRDALQNVWNTVSSTLSAQTSTNFNNNQDDATAFFYTFRERLDHLFQKQECREAQRTIDTLFGIQKTTDTPSVKRQETEYMIVIKQIHFEEIPDNTKPMAHLITNWTENNGTNAVLYQLPQYLTIVLFPYRYEMTQRGVEPITLNITIDAPEYITCIPHTDTPEAAQAPVLPSDAPVVTYRLNSTAIYSGSGTAGHYRAYVRTGEQWWSCDDTQINQKSGFPPQWNPAQGQGYPYILFYEKIEQKEAPEEPETPSDEEDETVTPQVPSRELWTSVYEHIWTLAQAAAGNLAT